LWSNLLKELEEGVAMPRVFEGALLFRSKPERTLAMVTAYTAWQARLAEEAGVDAILVGDSLGMVELGYETTLPVTLGEVLHHAKAVSRGVKALPVVVDLPFMSYQTGVPAALKAAGRVLKETRAVAVKLEGGKEVTPTVRAMVEAGIPVMGHIGLMPQHVRAMAGYRIQGKTEESASRLLEDALSLEAAGAFSVVIEGTRSEVARSLTTRLSIPTIGIGAGPYTDGQILVFHDVVGISPSPPKLARAFGKTSQEARNALTAYASAVREGSFPGPDETYG
jgi:3-methyl-2-oxobutanoate hydroxymethyltransferase